MGVPSNFDFLASRDERFARLGALADDASSALTTLRQMAELMAKDVAARHGLLPAPSTSFDDVLRTLRFNAVLPREISELFYHLKRVGNAAVHDNAGNARQALSALKIARAAAIWFHQSYGGKPSFRLGPFVPPTGDIPTKRLALLVRELSEALADIDRELERLETLPAFFARQNLEVVCAWARQREECDRTYKIAGSGIEWETRHGDVTTLAPPLGFAVPHPDGLEVFKLALTQ